MLFDIKEFHVKYKKDIELENDEYIKEEILKNGFMYIINHIYPLEKKDKKKWINFNIRSSIYFNYMFYQLIEQNKNYLNIYIKNQQVIVDNGGLFGWFIWFYIFEYKNWNLLFKKLNKYKNYIVFNNKDYISLNNIKFETKILFKDYDEYDNYLTLKNNNLKKIASFREILGLLFVLNFMKNLLEETNFYQNEYSFYLKKIKELYELVKKELKECMNYTIYYLINESFEQIETNIFKNEIDKQLTLIMDLFDYIINLKNRVVLKKVHANTISKISAKLLKEKKLNLDIINNDAKKIRDYLEKIKEDKEILAFKELQNGK